MRIKSSKKIAKKLNEKILKGDLEKVEIWLEAEKYGGKIYVVGTWKELKKEKEWNKEKESRKNIHMKNTHKMNGK